MSKEDGALCSSICIGNARNPTDVQVALETSKANWIIIAIGNGNSVAKSDTRTASAKATSCILQQPAFQHVRVVIVSTLGAGDSSVVVGMGVGKVISYMLRHVVRDHNGQEAAFLANPSLQHRTTVVRPTNLMDDEPTGKLVSFGNKEKCPSLKTDRQDLAHWIVREIFQDSNSEILADKEQQGPATSRPTNMTGPRVVNVTGVKQ